MFKHGPRLRFAGIAVTAVVAGAFVLHALSKYLAGEGLDTYRNVKGALMNYAGVLVTAGVFMLCAVAAYVARWWHFRQERRFEEIVRARASEANTVDKESARTGS